MINNWYTSDFAVYGGNVYLHNLFNDMSVATGSFLLWDGPSHVSSSADQSGGSVYYKEDTLSDVRFKFDTVDPASTLKQFKTLTAKNSHGGAFYLDVQGDVSILGSSVLF